MMGIRSDLIGGQSILFGSPMEPFLGGLYPASTTTSRRWGIGDPQWLFSGVSVHDLVVATMGNSRRFTPELERDMGS